MFLLLLNRLLLHRLFLLNPLFEILYLQSQNHRKRRRRISSNSIFFLYASLQPPLIPHKSLPCLMFLLLLNRLLLHRLFLLNPLFEILYLQSQNHRKRRRRISSNSIFFLYASPLTTPSSSPLPPTTNLASPPPSVPPPPPAPTISHGSPTRNPLPSISDPLPNPLGGDGRGSPRTPSAPSPSSDGLSQEWWLGTPSEESFFCDMTLVCLLCWKKLKKY
ncbi:hypothetical protein Bca52824_011194 [Brassica carinata]|uniref:Uncharacterized protein n=1 Tax=Brassica carinata TaxID=52824 RepID=A0A8X7WFC1_BRACI|nr:hypothetical protein Bca52824_011194 [Brassica carinata]